MNKFNIFLDIIRPYIDESLYEYYRQQVSNEIYMHAVRKKIINECLPHFASKFRIRDCENLSKLVFAMIYNNKGRIVGEYIRLKGIHVDIDGFSSNNELFSFARFIISCYNKREREAIKKIIEGDHLAQEIIHKLLNIFCVAEPIHKELLKRNLCA